MTQSYRASQVAASCKIKVVLIGMFFNKPTRVTSILSVAKCSRATVFFIGSVAHPIKGNKGKDGYQTK